jgi:hypothetical protein
MPIPKARPVSMAAINRLTQIPTERYVTVGRLDRPALPKSHHKITDHYTLSVFPSVFLKTNSHYNRR